MRKPVRSTVANRKYFQGGGLAPMKPAAPEEAVGIMASSQPLVDMVAQNAGNPQGGMSPLNFADGGLAKFQLGGVGNVPTPQNVPKSRLRRLGDLAMKFNPFPTFQSINPFRVALDKKTGPALMGIGRFLTDVPTDARLKNLSIDQLSTIEFQKNENPGRENDVEQAGRIAVTKNPSISPKELSLEINKLIKRAEPRELTSEEIERNKTSIDPITDKQREQSKKSIKEAEAQRIEEITKGIEGKDASDKDIKTEDFTFPFAKQTPEAEAQKNAENITSQDENITSQGQDQVETEQSQKNAMDQTIENINKSAEENNKEETKKNVSDYIDEFKAAMPQFEGMTEEEKGFAFMEAGLAIMGGQSPRALQNIAEGLKPLTKQFAKNKQQERAFNQQINIAAAKYGLERKNIDEQNALKLANELAKEDRKVLSFTVLKPFTAPDGQKYGKGDSYALTTGEFRDGALGKLPPGSVGDINAFKALEDTTQAYLALEAKRIEEEGGKGLKGSNFRKDRDAYVDHVEQLQSALASKVILGDAAKILTEGNIETGYGWVKDKINSSFNLLGVDNMSDLRKLYTNNRKKYDAKMKILSTQMLTAILNEGTKTVSDQDRQRVDELVGTLGGFFSGAIGKEILEEKLLYLDSQINRDMQSRIKKMQGIEATWQDQKVKDATINPSQILSGLRGDISVGSPREADKTYNWTDIYDEEKGTYREGAFS